MRMNLSELFDDIVCVINHDVRSAALLKGLDYEWNTASGVRSTLLEFLKNESLLPYDPSFVDYLEEVMKPRSFVESTTLPSRNELYIGDATNWRLTQHGNIYVVPAAARAIKVANLMGLCLFEMLGKTGSPHNSKSTATINRSRILLRLYDEGVKAVELERELELSETHVLSHCATLDELGLIELKRGYPTIVRLTERGKLPVKELLLPVRRAETDISYARDEYKRTLTEYKNDPEMMRSRMIGALHLLSAFNSRKRSYLLHSE